MIDLEAFADELERDGWPVKRWMDLRDEMVRSVEVTCFSVRFTIDRDAAWPTVARIPITVDDDFLSNAQMVIEAMDRNRNPE